MDFGVLKRLDLAKIRRYLPSGRDWLMVLAGAGLVLFVAAVLRSVERPPVPLAANPESTVDIRWLPETVTRWNNISIEMGKKYNIDPEVLAILMTLESGGYSRAESEAQAKGLLQITPPTAHDISTKFLKEPREQFDLFDPRTNIEFGAAYLAYLRDEFGSPDQGPTWDETVELLAAGYNGGPGAAGHLFRGEGLTSSETLSYSRDAFNMWRERRATASPTYNRWLERGGQRLIDLARTEQPPAP